MQQIKIFKGVESETGALEAEVNRWLAESKARVINLFGNIASLVAHGETHIDSR